MRDCGECSMCCYLPRIPELHKPPRSWCRNCDPGGVRCTIYSSPDRPNVCGEFQCAWLQNQKGEIFPDWMRPDKVHLVFAPNFTDESGMGHGYLIHLDPKRPMTKKTSQYLQKFLDVCTRNGVGLAVTPAEGAEFRIIVQPNKGKLLRVPVPA